MRCLARFLWWLGERDWFPFSTLRLWYWCVGHVGDAPGFRVDRGDPDWYFDPSFHICPRCGWKEFECACRPTP